MAEEQKLELMDFKIGTHHTISTGPYENIKVEASITCAVRRGTTDEQFKEILKQGEDKLTEILRETYKEARKRQNAIKAAQGN